MAVLDNRAELPGERRIGAALAMVIAGLDQMPQVVDHASADEKAALGIDRYAPGIARAFAEELELARLRMDAEQRTREAIGVAVVALHGGRIEHAVEAVEPAVRAPGERVGQLVRVGAAETSDDDFRLAGRFTIGAFFIEEDVRGVGDPDATVADRDT